MLNKLKKAIKYIVKKVKQGVKIMAKTINDTKCAVAHVAETGINAASEMYKTKCNKEIKKLDMAKSAVSTVYLDSKKVVKSFCSRSKNTITNVFSSMNNPDYKIIIGFGLVAIGIVDKLNNHKEVK